jgi:hypothetical protein
VGTAVLEYIMEGHDSPWAIDGRYHWILRDAKPLQFAPVRGKLSLFDFVSATEATGLLGDNSDCARELELVRT